MHVHFMLIKNKSKQKKRYETTSTKYASKEETIVRKTEFKMIKQVKWYVEFVKLILYFEINKNSRLVFSLTGQDICMKYFQLELSTKDNLMTPLPSSHLKKSDLKNLRLTLTLGFKTNVASKLRPLCKSKVVETVKQIFPIRLYLLQ